MKLINKLKGTKTEKNLLEVTSEQPQIQEESEILDKFTYLQKEGYDKINDYFLKTLYEKENPEIWFKKFDINGNIIDYTKMAKEAREEGFEETAQIFEWLSECLTQSETK
jgi:hypothetical protein